MRHIFSLPASLRRIGARFNGFRRNERGISAVEFALIAPLMALFYAGSVELASTLLADRKATSAAATLGDLTARLNAVNNCEVDDIFAATGLIFDPYDDTGVRLRVTSVVPTTANPAVFEVDWSYANANWTALGDAASVTLPAGIMATGGSVIMAEVEFPYSPPFDRVFQTDPILTDTFYMRPRSAARLNFTTVTCP